MQVHTADETINMIVEAMLKQGKGAVIRQDKDGHRVCVYRTVDDLSCAIGCLIPAHMSTEAIEHFSFNTIIENTFSSQKEIAEFLLNTPCSCAVDAQ